MLPTTTTYIAAGVLLMMDCLQHQTPFLYRQAVERNAAATDAEQEKYSPAAQGNLSQVGSITLELPLLPQVCMLLYASRHPSGSQVGRSVEHIDVFEAWPLLAQAT
eukprot:COSAG05_NODE_16902_length_336_cov_0.856540_1_plen_105_part_01